MSFRQRPSKQEPRAAPADVCPIVSINTLCLGPGSLQAHAATVAHIGATAISAGRQDIDRCGVKAACAILREAGLTVAALTHRAFAFVTAEEAAAARERLSRTIDMAHALGAQAICMTSGGRGALSWKEAAERFSAEIAPSVDAAKAAGVALALEPTSHLYADSSMTHRLSDTVTLARLSGVGVGIDLFACWTDADLDEAIAAAVPLTTLVQVSDYVLGDRGLPCRAVPGDGAVPVAALVSRILEAGYWGPFDIEVIGPRLAAEGTEPGLRRAVAYLRRATAAALP